jgi:hypothetical protein
LPWPSERLGIEQSGLFDAQKRQNFLSGLEIIIERRKKPSFQDSIID